MYVCIYTHFQTVDITTQCLYLTGLLCRSSCCGGCGFRISCANLVLSFGLAALVSQIVYKTTFGFKFVCIYLCLQFLNTKQYYNILYIHNFNFYCSKNMFHTSRYIYTSPRIPRRDSMRDSRHFDQDPPISIDRSGCPGWSDLGLFKVIFHFLIG